MNWTPPDTRMDNLKDVKIPEVGTKLPTGRILRVYVGGAYSSDNVIGVLRNMRNGIDLAVKVMKAGFAPFTPWLDFQIGLAAEFSVAEYQAASIAWLPCCDAMIVQAIGAEKSRGTQAEIAAAKELGIPVFYSLDTLEKWRDSATERKANLIASMPPA